MPRKEIHSTVLLFFMPYSLLNSSELGLRGYANFVKIFDSHWFGKEPICINTHIPDIIKYNIKAISKVYWHQKINNAYLWTWSRLCKVTVLVNFMEFKGTFNIELGIGEEWYNLKIMKITEIIKFVERSGTLKSGTEGKMKSCKRIVQSVGICS